MNNALDNFIKGPLTSILGLVLMAAAGYGWYTEWLTDLQGAGGGIVGFALLFMRDKLPVFLSSLFTGLIEKFTGKKNDPPAPPTVLVLLPLILFSFSAFSQVTDATLTTQNNNEIRNKTYSPSRAADMHQAIIDSKVSIASHYGTTTIFNASGTNTYTATVAPVPLAYAAGQRFFILFTNANSGASTININSLGAKAIRKNGTTVLASGDIAAGQVFCLAYDGTNFQLIGGGGTGGGGGSESTAWGNIPGTLSDQTDLQTALNAKVSTTRTVNGQALSSNVTIAKADIADLTNVDNTTDLNKPISTATQTALNAKQVTLVSGTNIKSVNGQTLLGSGDLAISGASWGTITGTLSSQSDLNTALGLKAPLASPTFTGAPTLPSGTIAVTQSPGNNSTAPATTAYVDALTALSTGSIVVGASGVSSAFPIGSANQLLGVNNGAATVEYKTVDNGLTAGSTSLKLGGALTANTSLTGAFSFTQSHTKYSRTSTFTTAASGEVGNLYTGTITQRATSSDDYVSSRFSPTVSFGAASQTYTGISLTPTVTANNFALGIMTGYDYNPTHNLGSGSISGHLAFRATSGNVLIGNTTGLSGDRLTVYGLSGNTIARYLNSAGSNRFQFGDGGGFIHTMPATASAQAYTLNGTYTLASGTADVTQLYLNPTYNFTGVFTGSVTGLLISPSVTSAVGLAEYGVIVSRSQAKNGFGVTPISTVDNVGSSGLGIATVSTTTTLDVTHHTVLVDATSGAVTINLPSATSSNRRVYVVKKIDASVNAVTIDGNASENIDGTTTKTISIQYAGYVIQSNGTQYFVTATF